MWSCLYSTKASCLSSDPFSNLLLLCSISHRANFTSYIHYTLHNLLHFPDSLVNRLPVQWDSGGTWGKTGGQEDGASQGTSPSLTWIVSLSSPAWFQLTIWSQNSSSSARLIAPLRWLHLPGSGNTISSSQSRSCFLLLGFPTILYMPFSIGILYILKPFSLEFPLLNYLKRVLLSWLGLS